jgi:adenylosuccinate lyase
MRWRISLSSVMFACRQTRQTAHEVVHAASMQGYSQGITFEQAIAAHPQANRAFGTEELDKLLDPTTYVGLAPAIVERILAETTRSGWIHPS